VGQVAKDFAHKYIKPHVMEWDETQHFPKDVLQEMGKLGLMGIFVPEKYSRSPPVFLTFFASASAQLTAARK